MAFWEQEAFCSLIPVDANLLRRGQAMMQEVEARWGLGAMMQQVEAHWGPGAMMQQVEALWGPGAMMHQVKARLD